MALMNISDFVASWRGKGDEKQDTQRYWIDLLHTVLGVENPTKHLLFEKRVKLEDSTRYIDVYIPETNVLPEQKGSSIDLSKPELQSGGASLTRYNQARTLGYLFCISFSLLRKYYLRLYFIILLYEISCRLITLS